MPANDAILVVDDDDDWRHALRMMLEGDGHFTLSASSAEEAMSVIAMHQPICVILDLRMPGVGGVELAKRIRSVHGTGMVLIVLTGSVEAADQDDAQRAGVDHVLHKPLDMQRLRDIIPRAS